MRAAVMAMVSVLTGCAAESELTFEISVRSTRGTVTLDGERVERVERTASSFEQARRTIEVVVVVELPEGRVEETARPGLCDPRIYPELTFEGVAYDVNTVTALYPQLTRQQCDDIVLVNTARHSD